MSESRRTPSSAREEIERRDPSPASRIALRVPVSYRSAGADIWGEGTSWNISRSGALLEWASKPAPVGTELLLWFSFFPGSTGTALPGTVTRTTPNGFAVRFGELEDDQVYLLKRALPDGA